MQHRGLLIALQRYNKIIVLQVIFGSRITFKNYRFINVTYGNIFHRKVLRFSHFFRTFVSINTMVITQWMN